MCNFLFRNIFDNLIFKYLPFQIMIKIYKNCKIGENSYLNQIITDLQIRNRLKGLKYFTTPLNPCYVQCVDIIVV